jgi:hypothetical protein
MVSGEVTAADLFSPAMLTKVCCSKPSCILNMIIYNGATCSNCKKKCKTCPAKSREFSAKSESAKRSHLPLKEMKSR